MGWLLCPGLLSQFHKRLIHRDAKEPCRELRIFPEFAQMLKDLQESFLNRVLGIFSITGDALSDSEKLAIVSLYQLLEGLNIAILTGMHKIQIAAFRGSHFELC